MVLGPSVLASPGNLGEVQTLSSYPRPNGPDMAVGLRKLFFNKLSKWTLGIVKCEKHCIDPPQKAPCRLVGWTGRGEWRGQSIFGYAFTSWIKRTVMSWGWEQCSVLIGIRGNFSEEIISWALKTE